MSSFPQSYNRQASTDSLSSDNINVYKGEFHSILPGEFIQVVYTNPLALEFWSFLNGTSIPDELLSHYKIWVDKLVNECQSA